jgi:hypothetical protein
MVSKRTWQIYIFRTKYPYIGLVPKSCFAPSRSELRAQESIPGLLKRLSIRAHVSLLKTFKIKSIPMIVGRANRKCCISFGRDLLDLDLSPYLAAHICPDPPCNTRLRPYSHLSVLNHPYPWLATFLVHYVAIRLCP